MWFQRKKTKTPAWDGIDPRDAADPVASLSGLQQNIDYHEKEMDRMKEKLLLAQRRVANRSNFATIGFVFLVPVSYLNANSILIGDDDRFRRDFSAAAAAAASPTLEGAWDKMSTLQKYRYTRYLSQGKFCPPPAEEAAATAPTAAATATIDSTSPNALVECLIGKKNETSQWKFLVQNMAASLVVLAGASAGVLLARRREDDARAWLYHHRSQWKIKQALAERDAPVVAARVKALEEEKARQARKDFEEMVRKGVPPRPQDIRMMEEIAAIKQKLHFPPIANTPGRGKTNIPAAKPPAP